MVLSGAGPGARLHPAAAIKPPNQGGRCAVGGVTTVLRRVLVILAAVLALLGAGPLSAASAASAAPVTTSGGAGGGHGHGGDYLALGDSVPFGFNPLLPIGSDPADYVGYPELAARRLDLRVTNLSCPGQTSGGFLSMTGTDNGCFDFRGVASLHTSYPGSQLDAALTFLRTHPDTRLVTIMIGANDLLLCDSVTADRCAAPAEIAAVQRTVRANLTRALTAIRAIYRGPLVAVSYYAPYPAVVSQIMAVNGVLSSVTRRFGGSVADAFTLFQQRAAQFGGDPCAAGLLIPLPTGGCDIHPSPAGARLLARSVVHAVWAEEREERRAA